MESLNSTALSLSDANSTLLIQSTGEKFKFFLPLAALLPTIMRGLFNLLSSVYQKFSKFADGQKQWFKKYIIKQITDLIIIDEFIMLGKTPWSPDNFHLQVYTDLKNRIIYSEKNKKITDIREVIPNFDEYFEDVLKKLPCGLVEWRAYHEQIKILIEEHPKRGYFKSLYQKSLKQIERTDEDRKAIVLKFKEYAASDFPDMINNEKNLVNHIFHVFKPLFHKFNYKSKDKQSIQSDKDFKQDDLKDLTEEDQNQEDLNNLCGYPNTHNSTDIKVSEIGENKEDLIDLADS